MQILIQKRIFFMNMFFTRANRRILAAALALLLGIGSLIGCGKTGDG